MGIRGSQDEAEKGAEDVDLKGHEDRLLSHGRGLTEPLENYCPAVPGLSSESAKYLLFV